jgi:hypothetical protein
MIPAWNGRRVQQARIYMTRYLPAMCAADQHAPTCPGVIDGEDPKAWVVGHIASRAAHPEKTWDVRNWRIEARVCSDASGPPTAIANAYAAGQRDAIAAKSHEEKTDEDLDTDEKEEALFSCAPHIRADKPAALSLSGTSRPRITSASKARPLATTREPLEIRSDLGWDAERVRSYPWLAEFADVPDDASPPLAMTYPTAEAVCSYGWAGCTHLADDATPVVAWAEAEHRMTLRWWQRFAIVRQHEHRADGSLIWAEVVESASRRSGKSHRMRAVATWRLAHAAVIGELQAIVHCGNDLAVCRDVQKKAWRWAVGRWGAKAVKEGNGKELIENPLDGSSWVVKAQGAAYGLDANLALADECWDVKPDTISEGLEPMLLERLWAQLHLTSTAHRRARSTMKTRIAQALAADDGRTLLLWWAALPQDDPGDPETWRKASPHWSADRARYVASKYEKALAGEEDPEADDPDPMEGFRAQYLNVWPPLNVKVVRGEAIVDKASWSELVIPKPTATPIAAAIAAHFDAGISLAIAWRLADGAALVSVGAFDDAASAGLALVASGFTGEAVTDGALTDDPGLALIRKEKATGRGAVAVLDLARLLAEGQVTHDGGDHLTRQVLAVRTVDGADGVRLASNGRLDAVKAAAWAASAARSKPVRRAGTRVLVASG